MNVKYVLEDFRKSVDITPQNSSPTEREKVDAFEEGYKAGWDDASLANEHDFSRISSHLENNLNDLAFTFHEARLHVLQNIEQLIQQLFEKLLPTVCHETLVPHVVEKLNLAFSELSDGPVVLRANAKTIPSLENILPEKVGFPITIKDENTLSEGQVHFVFGASEEILDLDLVLNSVQELFTEFFQSEKDRVVNG